MSTESAKAAAANPLARRLVFSGRVQGVGFRYTAWNAARRLRLSGFVRNLADGDVEAVVQGDAEAIERFLAELQNHFQGYIRNIDIKETACDARRRGFEIAY